MKKSFKSRPQHLRMLKESVMKESAEIQVLAKLLIT